MKFKVILMSAMILAGGNINAEDRLTTTEDSRTYKQIAQQSGSNMFVTSDPGYFRYEILYKMNGNLGQNGFKVVEYLGFSGADYLAKDTVLSNFRESVLAEYEAVEKETKGKGTLVILLGGTVDGFGAGYEEIEKLRESGRIKNVIVGGLVAGQAVGYHVEGMEKGWGDVISSKQDALLLLETMKDSSGERTWELKQSERHMSQTIEVLVNLSAARGALGAKMTLFEGGAQAFKEAIGFVAAAHMAPDRSFTLDLKTGYEPGRIEKDKGWRAATDVANFLTRNQSLLPSNLKATISPYFGVNPVDIRTLSGGVKPYFMGADAPRLGQQTEASQELVETAKAERQKVLSSINEHALVGIEEVRVPIQDRLGIVMSWLGNVNHPVHESERGLSETRREAQGLERAIKFIDSAKESINIARAIELREKARAKRR